MEKFAQGEIKILICTNIVESGLDIQNANTIIIQDVQQFGLAQLYQVLFFLLSFVYFSKGAIWRTNKYSKLLPWLFFMFSLIYKVNKRLLKLVIHFTYSVSFALCFPLNGNSCVEGWGGQIRKLMHTYFTQRSHF